MAETLTEKQRVAVEAVQPLMRDVAMCLILSQRCSPGPPERALRTYPHVAVWPNNYLCRRGLYSARGLLADVWTFECLSYGTCGI